MTAQTPAVAATPETFSAGDVPPRRPTLQTARRAPENPEEERIVAGWERTMHDASPLETQYTRLVAELVPVLEQLQSLHREAQAFRAEAARHGKAELIDTRGWLAMTANGTPLVEVVVLPPLVHGEPQWPQGVIVR